MNKWRVDDLSLTVDSVLRGQGADPDLIRSRNPRLADIAEKALNSVTELLEPEVFIKEFKVSNFKQNSIVLENGYRITGPIVSGHLLGATHLSAVVCTVGPKIDDYTSEVMDDDIVLALAVDGVGAAAVESLANAVCRKIETEAKKNGLQTTIPLSPGIIGWDVDEGQTIIFDLFGRDQISVSLTTHFLMIPRKSLSMMIGIGPNICSGERICDYCAIRDTCQYKDQNKEIQ